MMRHLLLLNLTAVIAVVSSSASPMRHRLLAPISVGMRSAAGGQKKAGGGSAAIAMPSRSSITFTGHLSSSQGVPVDVSEVVARGGAAAADAAGGPPKYLRWAYAATGVATTAAWATMTYTTIRSNQPQGAMMPCWQHGVFARIGAMSAAGLIAGASFWS